MEARVGDGAGLSLLGEVLGVAFDFAQAERLLGRWAWLAPYNNPFLRSA